MSMPASARPKGLSSRSTHSGRCSFPSAQAAPNESGVTATGEKALAEGVCDAVAYGRLFISNPDLVERLKANSPLAEGNVRTWYSQGPHGYSDYPRAGVAV